jgi:hypothetical protein
MARPKSTVLAVAVLFGGLYAAQADAQGYNFKEITAPNMGSTIFQSINSSKTILSEVSASGSMTCYIRQGNTQTPLADPNGTTYCYQLDDAGVVVGFYIPASNTGTQIGFIYTPSTGGGTYQDYIVPAADVQNGGTQLSAISTNGIIAGSYATKKAYQVAFLLVNGNRHDITVTGQNYMIPSGVNDSKQVVLQTFNAGGQFQGNLLLSNGSTTAIAYPNATLTVAHTITNAGVVVGEYADSQGLKHGYTYNSATATYSAPIDDPHTTGGLLLLGINKKGIVVGATLPNPQTSIFQGAIGTPNGQ